MNMMRNTIIFLLFSVLYTVKASSLCDRNERVLNGTCIACAAGTTNGAGENSSSADTTCVAECVFTDSDDLQNEAQDYANGGSSFCNGVDISEWDVSRVTDMSNVFEDSDDFNGDISNWDTSSATTMERMFYEAKSFNGDLANWDTSSVNDFGYMFYNTHAFKGDLTNWDLSGASSLAYMFYHASAFNGDVSNWDVSHITRMDSTFEGAYHFNGDLSQWNTSQVTTMREMFKFATNFNGDITSWNVNKVTTMQDMFYHNPVFNGAIGQWNVSSVNNMDAMFFNAKRFNADVSGWDVSSVTKTYEMFAGARQFNCDLNDWDVSSVTNMIKMFASATAFNSDLGKWDVSSVIRMSYIFAGTTFNNNISEWDTSSVTVIEYAFAFNEKFNSDISKWDTSGVRGAVFFSLANNTTRILRTFTLHARTQVQYMRQIFMGASSFDQDLSSWNMATNPYCDTTSKNIWAFTNTDSLSDCNKYKIFDSWRSQSSRLSSCFTNFGWNDTTLPSHLENATCCNTNEYVSSGVCTACPAGRSNHAGDATSFNHTDCMDPCVENERVLDGQCVSCPTDTIKAAGGDPEGDRDTLCEATSTDWTLTQSVQSPLKSHGFTKSVAFSRDGTFMVVGAPDYGLNGWKEVQGHAYVYKRDASSNEYEMIQEFAGFHDDSDNGFDGFGFAVDMSADGNTILVAAGSDWYNGGYIRMFKRSDSLSSYEQYGSDIFGFGATDYGENGFARWAAMSPDASYIVGCEDDSTSSNRLCDVLKDNGTAYTLFQGEINADDRSEWTGWAKAGGFSEDGSVMVLASWADDEELGGIRVYQNNGTAYNVQQEIWKRCRQMAVTPDGNTMACGQPFGGLYDSQGNPGIVWVYSRSNATQNFTLKGSKIQNDNPDVDYDMLSTTFGRSVDMSDDGNTVVVGAMEYWSDHHEGFAATYKYMGDQWVHVDEWRGTHSGDHFGYEVSISGDGESIAVGTSPKLQGDFDFGNAYMNIYTLTSDDDDSDSSWPAYGTALLSVGGAVLLIGLIVVVVVTYPTICGRGAETVQAKKNQGTRQTGMEMQAPRHMLCVD